MPPLNSFRDFHSQFHWNLLYFEQKNEGKGKLKSIFKCGRDFSKKPTKHCLNKVKYWEKPRQISTTKDKIASIMKLRIKISLKIVKAEIKMSI